MTSLSYATDEYLEQLRPTSFDDLIGQRELISTLRRLVRQARRENQSFPPVLLVGSPGVGRRAIASAMAYELVGGDKQRVQIVDAAQLEEADRFEAIFDGLTGGDVLVVEELHRLDAKLADRLTDAASGVTVSIRVSENGERPVKVGPSPFSLLATARTGAFQGSSDDWNPLRVRAYNTEELVAIAHWCADRLGIELTDSAAFRLARHSRGYSRRLKSMIVQVLLDSVESLSQKGSWLVDEQRVRDVLE